MHLIDEMAGVALNVLLILGLLLLVTEAVGAIRRRRADPWRELARRDRVPPER